MKILLFLLSLALLATSRVDAVSATSSVSITTSDTVTVTGTVTNTITTTVTNTMTNTMTNTITNTITQTASVSISKTNSVSISLSNTNTGTPSTTESQSNTWTKTVTVTQTQTQSVSSTITQTASNSWTQTNSGTQSVTVTGTITPTYSSYRFAPPANLVANCIGVAGHSGVQIVKDNGQGRTFACIKWQDPIVYSFYNLTLFLSTPLFFTFNLTSERMIEITNLSPGTTYKIGLQGIVNRTNSNNVNEFVPSQMAILSFTTLPASPRLNSALGITGFTVSVIASAQRGRSSAKFSWTPGPITHKNIRLHVKCSRGSNVNGNSLGHYKEVRFRRNIAPKFVNSYTLNGFYIGDKCVVNWRVIYTDLSKSRQNRMTFIS